MRKRKSLDGLRSPSYSKDVSPPEFTITTAKGEEVEQGTFHYG